MVVVDDGSTDGTLERLRLGRRRPDRVTVLTKENGGQSTARNLGLEHARGEWVTFTDPDDVLDPAYLQEVDAFLGNTPRRRWSAPTGSSSTTRPGSSRTPTRCGPHFAGKNALRYLDGWPTHFHGSAPAAFFRRARIEELGLRFDPEVRPNFEDGHFCVRYLLAEERPAVGFVKTRDLPVPQAVRRQLDPADQPGQPRPLHHVPSATATWPSCGESMVGRERPPEWLQNYIVYELSWYFTSQDAHAATGGSASGAVAEEFHALMAEICALLEPRRDRELPAAIAAVRVCASS